MTRGHRTLPHTADTRIQAWAPTVMECIAEAVLAMSDSFLDTAGGVACAEQRVRLAPGRPEDRLVAALDEVIYRMDTTGQVPIRATPEEDGLLLATAEVETMAQTGAVPKAVTLHRLAFEQRGDQWMCTVTLDV
ncbi:archease [Nonomuraea sp. NPDC003201]